MKPSIIFDTDVLIDFLRGYKKAVKLVNNNPSRMIFSSIVVAELYAGVKGNSERSVLDDLISMFHVIPVTTEIAVAGGLYKREYGKSHGVGLADAILAASVQSENAEMATLNTKHYPMIKNLKPAYKKD